MKGKHRNYDLASQFRHSIPVQTPDFKSDVFGRRGFYQAGTGVIARWTFKGANIYEGSYFSDEFEAGVFLGRQDRNYFYRSYHSHDSQYYDRYIFDESRDELYFSYGKTIALPISQHIKLISGARVSLQQSLHASGTYNHYLSFKVENSQSYWYTPDITDPGDIFGRTKKTETYEGQLKPCTGVLLELPLVVSLKPAERISFQADFRWGWGMSIFYGSRPLYKSMFGIGIGMGYDL